MQTAYQLSSQCDKPKDVSQLKTELQTSHHFIRFAYCNALLPANAKFCSSCGKKIEQKKNGGLETYRNPVSGEVQEQEAKTTHLPVKNSAHMKFTMVFNSQLHLRHYRIRPPLLPTYLNGGIYSINFHCTYCSILSRHYL
jgi:hypothetical protein